MQDFMFADKWLKPNSIWALDEFLKLPRRAQELLTNYLLNSRNEKSAHFLYVNGIGNEDISSPIEQIYYLASSILFYEENNINLFDMPIPQYEIKCNDNKFIADFFYSNEEAKNISKDQGHEYQYSDIHVVVECDGHKFHKKTKQQVIHDNERQMAIQLTGYDIIRFSGSQICGNPMKCAKEAHDFIRMKLGVSITESSGNSQK